MKDSDVIKIYSDLENLGVHIWVDGGWGVDALLEKQIRFHKDLDIAVQEKDLSKLTNYFSSLGYKYRPRNDTRAWNFVVGDNNGHDVDVHVINIDSQGNGIYGPPENNEMYPASALTGTGKIAGRSVRCISAEDMVKFHSGYRLTKKDYQDVRALCAKFGLPLPKEYDFPK